MDRSLTLSKDLHHNDPYTDYISWPGHSDRHFKYPISFSWNDWELSLPCPTSGPPLLPLLLLLSLLTASFTQILPLGLCSSFKDDISSRGFLCHLQGDDFDICYLWSPPMCLSPALHFPLPAVYFHLGVPTIHQNAPKQFHSISLKHGLLSQFPYFCWFYQNSSLHTLSAFFFFISSTSSGTQFRWFLLGQSSYSPFF